MEHRPTWSALLIYSSIICSTKTITPNHLAPNTTDLLTWCRNKCSVQSHCMRICYDTLQPDWGWSHHTPWYPFTDTIRTPSTYKPWNCLHSQFYLLSIIFAIKTTNQETQFHPFFCPLYQVFQPQSWSSPGSPFSLSHPLPLLMSTIKTATWWKSITINVTRDIFTAVRRWSRSVSHRFSIISVVEI